MVQIKFKINKGYIVPPASVKFDVETDLTVGEVKSAEVLSQTEVRVTFNKAMSLSEVTNYSSNFAWQESGTSVKRYANTSATLDKVDDYTWDIQFTDRPLKAGATVDIVVAGDKTNDLVDFAGNIAADTTIKGLEVPAVTDPTITKVESDEDSKFTVYFNKKMDQTSIQDKDHYELYDADGDEIDIPSNGSWDSDDEDNVTFTLSTNLEPGTYTLKVIDNDDIKDPAGNYVDVQEITFEVADTTVPADGDVSFSGTYDATNDIDTIYVQFDQAMMFSGENSVLNKKNWELAINNGTYTSATFLNLEDIEDLAGVDEVSITKENDKRIKITIEGVSTNYIGTNSTNFLRGKLIADAAGNVAPTYVDNATSATTFALTAVGSAQLDLSTSGAVEDLKVVGNNKIEFTLTRKFDTIDVNDFEVYNIASAAYVNKAALDLAGTSMVATDATVEEDEDDSSKSVVTLTMAEDFDLDDAVYVATSSDPVSEDLLGLELVADKVIATTGGNATVAANKVAATIDKVFILDDESIIVRFDKDIAYVNRGDFRIKINSEDEITPSAATVVSGNTKEVRLDISGTTISGTDAVKVRTVEESKLVTLDTNNVTITANTDLVDAQNNSVKSVSFVKANDSSKGALAGGDQIVVEFENDIPATVTSWVQSIMLDETGDKIELHNSLVGGTHDATTLVGTIASSGDTVAAGADNHVAKVVATRGTDKNKLILTVTTDGSNTITAYDFNYAAGNVSTLEFADNTRLVDEDGYVMNLGRVLATTEQLVDAKTLGLAFNDTTDEITLTTNYGVTVSGVRAAAEAAVADTYEALEDASENFNFKQSVIAGTVANCSAITLDSDASGVMQIDDTTTGAVAETTVTFTVQDKTDTTITKAVTVKISDADGSTLVITE